MRVKFCFHDKLASNTQVTIQIKLFILSCVMLNRHRYKCVTCVTSPCTTLFNLKPVCSNNDFCLPCFKVKFFEGRCLDGLDRVSSTGFL